MLVQQLSSLIEDAAGLEPWQLTGAELREVVAQVHKARSALDALASRLMSSADDMGLAAEDGVTSTTVWFAHTAGATRTDAGKLMAAARVTSSSTEATRVAWSLGRLNTDQALVIMKAIDSLPGHVTDQQKAAAEADLIGRAADHDLRGLQILANRVVAVIDPEGADAYLGRKLAEEEKRAWDATRIAIRRRGDGTSRLSGIVPETYAAKLRTALEGIAAPRRAETNATRHAMSVGDFTALPHAQKMGLAFCELIDHLPSDALPQAGGLAATVTVNVDADVLATGRGTARTSSGDEVSADEAQRMACNSHLVALFLDTESRVTDVGLSQRLYDRRQRLALAARDQGCVWAGCDRPPAWCEAHHLTFWSDHGPTDLTNAALLCHYHHHLIHQHEWTAHMAPDGVVEIIPPRRVDPQQVPRRHARFLDPDRHRQPHAA